MTGGLSRLDHLPPQSTTAFTPQPQPLSSEEDGAWASKKVAFEPYHAKKVPKPENLGVRVSDDSRSVTTMMLRNIPNKYTQATLLQEIDEFGFAGKYDFFYLPMDVHYRSNVGYAFINFTAPQDAIYFNYVFAQHRFQRYESHKIGGVCVAHLQGLDENLRHFEKKAVTQAKNNQYRPIVFDGNCRVEFEEAVLGAKLRAGAMPSSKKSELRPTAGAHRPSPGGVKAAVPHGVSQRAPSPECLDQLFLGSKLAVNLQKEPQREREWKEAACPAGKPKVAKAPPGLPCPGTWELPPPPTPAGPAKTASQDPAYVTFDPFSSSLVFGGYGKAGFEFQAAELQDAVEAVTPRTNKLILGSSLEHMVPDGPW